MSSVIEEVVETTGDGFSAVAPLPDVRPEVFAYFRLKETVLRPVGALLFVGSLPVLLVLMLLVKATSRGPAVYRQSRVGKDGREFVLYKLRTMYKEAEKLTGPIWSQPQDSRITPVGKLLRLLHLDELPQLWNVVRGEMDLVGPRPERPEIVDELIKEIPNYLDRSKVLPGVTGLAQVNFPPDQSIDCVRRKLLLDREYIETASLWLDIRLVVCTALRMVGIRHGYAVRWMGLERNITLPPGTAQRPTARDRSPFSSGAVRLARVVPDSDENGSRRPRPSNTVVSEVRHENSRAEAATILQRSASEYDPMHDLNLPRHRPR